MNNQYLISGLCLVFGLMIFGMAAVGPLGTYQEVQSHETTEGTVVSSAVEERGTVGDREYRPVVEFEYEVDGQQYTGDRIYLDTPGGTKDFDQRSEAEDLRERFEEGETVTVYYDPDDPTMAYLVESAPVLRAILFVAFGAIVFGTGIAGALGRIDFE